MRFPYRGGRDLGQRHKKQAARHIGGFLSLPILAIILR